MGRDAPQQFDAPSILQRNADRLLGYLELRLNRFSAAPPRLMEAIRYSLLNAGKRLRPTLVLESFAACMAQDTARLTARSVPSAIASAAAMEMIHTFSLVHDDLPAMDDDDLRRGKPTNHKVFGEAMAILAGDAMMTMAFELISADADPALVPALVRELAHAAGPQGMIGGQVLDMAGENQALALEQLQQIHRLKTGALLTTSCRLGAIAAVADTASLDAMTRFGQHLGLAFQIVDDILDVTSTPQQLGKATNKDASRGKNTYPALLGLDASRIEARRQLDSALGALDSFGSTADALRTLCRFVVERQV